jgi:hypothetical protein
VHPSSRPPCLTPPTVRTCALIAPPGKRRATYGSGTGSAVRAQQALARQVQEQLKRLTARGPAACTSTRRMRGVPPADGPIL